MSGTSKVVAPSFIVIGPGRTGSSWMYEMLLQHPEVCMAQNSKETLFFNRYYEKGIDWYLSFFKDCTAYRAVGEISTTYFHHEGVPERIAEHCPNVQLIACLREPFERLVSAYYYRKRAGETVLPLEEALEKEPDLLEESLYDRQLERFLDHFPRERVKVLFYEDLKRDPEAFLTELFQVIGVDTEFVPEGSEKKVNRRSEERIPGLGRLLGAGSAFLRTIGAYRILDRIKRSSTVKSLFLKEKEGEAIPELSTETLKKLEKRFEEVRLWVSSFTGRELKEWERRSNG